MYKLSSLYFFIRRIYFSKKYIVKIKILIVNKWNLQRYIGTVVQYNTVKPNLKGPADLLRFRDSFGFKKAKIKKRKIPDLIYLSVHPIDSV